MTWSPLEGPLGPALLKVVKGAPTAEELAAVTLLLSTAAAAGAEPEPRPAPAAAAWDRPSDRSPVSWAARR
ncbi:acyl-CoA carboxylase epsilon subunit [Streptomyces sp. NPDC054864]